MENTNEIEEQDVQGNIRTVYNEENQPIYLEYLEYNPKTNAYEYNYLCRFFAVILVLTNITTNEVSIKIRYLQAGVYMEKIINRSEISSQSFGSLLLSIGLDIDLKLISYAREAIFLSEEAAEHQYTFSKIGWHSMLGEVDYFLRKPLISDDEVQPTYEGYFNFSTKGTFEGWKSDFAPILQQNNYLAAIFSTGLTAILIGYLNLVHEDIGSKLVDIDTMVVSLVGLTSKGKSISAQFCGGLYSSPYKSENSIFITTNFTNNFAVNMLSDNHGVLQIFDDTSSTKSLKEYADLAYMLSQNQSRGPETKNYGKNSERASWSTLVMTTTEYTLSLLEDNRKGKFVRNLEFEFPYFTKSAEEADEIKRKLGNNYGVVAEVFAKAVFGIDKLELVEMYDDCKILLLQKATIKDGLSDRIIGNIASILLSAKIAKDYMEMPINIEEITKVLLTVHDDGATTRTETPTPLEFIKKYVSINRRKSFKSCLWYYKKSSIC